MSSSWLHFVSPVKRPSFVTSGWGAWRGYRGSYHHGLDFSANVGDPIYAVGPGLVEIAARGSETAGNWIAIRHEGDLLTRYLHLTDLYVQEGQSVYAGQKIGTAGSTGTSSAPHLHFDAHAMSDSALASYVALFGTPVGGFEGKTDYGWKVPSEPLVPVDKYDSDVAADAAKYGIPLYGQIAGRGLFAGKMGGILAAGAGLTALGFAFWYFMRTRGRWV